MKKFFLLPFLLLPLIFSCTSLQQDIVLSSSDYVNDADLQRIESLLAQYDADSFLGNHPDAGRLSDLSDLIDASLKDAELKNAVKSRLLAMKGRVSLLSGRKNKAKELYESSVAAFKGDAQTMVLASRLALVDSLEYNLSMMSGASEKALLTLETALNSYLQKDYIAAVTAFDQAFISLPGYYRTSYKPIRDRAWNFRNVSGASSDKATEELLTRGSLSVGQMLLVAQNASSVLLPYTGGTVYSQGELYKRISRTGLLSDAKGGSPLDERAPVTKLAAARFLWNLYRDKKNIRQDRYSEAFSGSGESPVPDVPVDSPDFDAVLGCVENELMHLSDGINFTPDKAVSGYELLDFLGKI